MVEVLVLICGLASCGLTNAELILMGPEVPTCTGALMVAQQVAAQNEEAVRLLRTGEYKVSFTCLAKKPL